MSIIIPSTEASTLTTLKARLRRRLADSPLRAVAAPAFDAAIAGQLRLLRAFDVDDRASCDASGVTAIIKAFERPHSLRRLLGSLRRFRGLRIVVADDSRQPLELPGVRTVRLPYDSGVSAGRQAALDVVDTELTWILDDDFVAFRGTRLAKVVQHLQEYARLDLVGGPVIDLPLLSRRGSTREHVYPTPAQPLTALGTRYGDAIVCDKVPNFFVARTERLRRVGWDARLRRVEHGDFFTRARGALTTAFLTDFSCLHAQSPFDRAYMAKRDDYAADEALLKARYFPEA